MPFPARIVGPLLLASSLAVLFPSCDGREGREAGSPVTPVPVRVTRVTRRSVPLARSLAGTLRPLERATVAARTMGTVVQADFVLGQAVSAGQLIVTLSAPELSARRDQALATLEQAKRELARETGLAATGASTTDALRAAADRVHIAEAALQEAAALLEQTRVTAPFTGVITRKFVYSGDLAHPATPLFELEARDQLRAEVQVPDTLPVPAIGTSLSVDLGDRIVTGIVDEVSPSADPMTHTREARIRLPAAAGARSGQFVRAEWPAGSSDALVVPAACVGLFGQIERVFVARDGRAELRLVRPGPVTGDSVQILSGVTEGETILLAPPATLRDGDAIRTGP